MKRITILQPSLDENLKDAPMNASDTGTTTVGPGYAADTGTTTVGPGYAPVLEAMKKFITFDPLILKGNYGITEGGLTAADPEVVGSGITEGVWFGGIIDNSPAGYVNRQAITLKHEPIRYEALRRFI